MNANKLFAKLLDEGISSVAKRQDKLLAAIETELADMLGYSVHTVQHWRRGNIPPQIEHVGKIVQYCKQNGRIDHAWAQSLLTQAQFPDADGLLNEIFGVTQRTNSRVFLCYSRVSESEITVALNIAQALSQQQLSVFFDQAIHSDRLSVTHIRDELLRADFVIVFLTAETVQSDVILWELCEIAAIREKNAGRPILLPVRLSYGEPLSGP
jgi:hypothetical protein